jgi:hypothetical protein
MHPEGPRDPAIDRFHLNHRVRPGQLLDLPAGLLRVRLDGREKQSEQQGFHDFALSDIEWGKAQLSCRAVMLAQK